MITQCTIAISDQNQLFREGLKSLLARSQFTVLCCVETLDDVLAQTDGVNPPDLVLCGLDRDDDLPARLSDFAHAAGSGPKIVVLAHVPTATLLQRAAAAGVHAVLSRNISGEVLQRALEFVLLGQRLFPAPDHDRTRADPAPLAGAIPPGGRTRLDPSVQLSEREAQILGCLVRGAPNKQIARQLGITEATVKVHIKGLLRKLRVNNRTQAAVWGMNNPYATEANDGPILRLVDTGTTLSIAS